MVPLTAATMPRLRELHPEVELLVTNAGLDQPTAGLREGRVDVACVRRPFVDDGISMVTVLTEEQLRFVPRGVRHAFRIQRETATMSASSRPATSKGCCARSACRRASAPCARGTEVVGPPLEA